MSRLRHFYDALNEGVSLKEADTGEPESNRRESPRAHAATAAPDKLIAAELGVPVHAKLDRSVRAIPHSVDSVTVEHYRRLRTKLLQEQESKPFRTLMIASPNPREGKSVTALNLALSFSMLPSFRVLVVDGDLRKGSLGKWLGIEGTPGLSNLIEGTAALSDVVLKSDAIPVRFVVRGDSPAPPAELLNSPRARESFEEMARHFDLVIIDSAPLTLVTDAQLIARRCDAILMVARAFSTPQKAFEKAVQDLAPCRVVGTVLNGGTSVKRYRQYKGYY